MRSKQALRRVVIVSVLHKRTDKFLWLTQRTGQALAPPPAGFQWLFSLCSRSFSQEMKIRETRRLTLECALTSVAGYCQKLPIWYWLEGESLIRDEDDMKN